MSKTIGVRMAQIADALLEHAQVTMIGLSVGIEPLIPIEAMVRDW